MTPDPYPRAPEIIPPSIRSMPVEGHGYYRPCQVPPPGRGKFPPDTGSRPSDLSPDELRESMERISSRVHPSEPSNGLGDSALAKDSTNPHSGSVTPVMDQSWWWCPECGCQNAYENRTCRGCLLKHPGKGFN